MVKPCPAIDLEGDLHWTATHPGAQKRDWRYMSQETERLTIEHLTGEKLPPVDAGAGNRESASQQAITTYEAQRCVGPGQPQAAARAAEIDALLASRIGAIRNEEQALRQRYDLPDGVPPVHLNFDVTFQTMRETSPAS